MASRRSLPTVTGTCDHCTKTFTWTDHGSALTSDLVYLVVLDDGQKLNLCNPCHIRARRGEQRDTLVPARAEPTRPGPNDWWQRPMQDAGDSVIRGLRF